MATITVKINDDNFIKIQVDSNSDFRFVEGTEDNAVVSVDGEILKRYCKSRTTGERKDYYEYVHPTTNRSGYLQVSVPERKDLKLVHRIVAETFVDNPKGYNEIDHVNRDKSDNRACNLRWCTHKENMVNIPKCTEKTYYRDITAVDLVTGKEYFFKKPSDIIPLAQERNWGQGWGYRLRKLFKQDGTAYGFYWSTRVKETVNIG